MPSVSAAAHRLTGGSRKEQIVRVVLDLVAAHGVEAVSAQLIADAIGVTQPAVFRHFPTKEAIWLAVMDWLEEQLGAVHRTVERETTEPALVGLGRMFLGHVRLIGRHPALAKLVFADHLRLQYPNLQRRFMTLHRRYHARLAAVIDRGKDGGEIDAKLSTEVAVTMFLCMVQGLAFQFAIARIPMKLMREADRMFELYVRTVGA